MLDGGEMGGLELLDPWVLSLCEVVVAVVEV